MTDTRKMLLGTTETSFSDGRIHFSANDGQYLTLTIVEQEGQGEYRVTDENGGKWYFIDDEEKAQLIPY